jgi:beta-glucanase (GH16 family)
MVTRSRILMLGVVLIAGLVLLLTNVLSSSGSSVPPPPPTAGLKLVWSDEFNGPAGSAPSARRWHLAVGRYGSADHEQEIFTSKRANSQLDGNGDLVITARATGPGIPQTRSYTSARLDTSRLFSTRYGVIEARMKLPPGRGLWDAFWLLGDDYPQVGWPRAGELDVMEALGQEPGTVQGHIHGPVTGASGQYQVGFVKRLSRPLTDSFHTYGVSWAPNSVSWFLDGKVYGKATPTSLRPNADWVFNAPFHLILNLSVGGDWAGPPDANTPFPASTVVDWVRVYGPR